MWTGELPRRVLVTGAAGSGKTTMARHLSALLAVPHVELDAGHPESGAENAGGWVIEGGAAWNLERFLTTAGLIVWLDLPLRYTMPRIVRRHVRLSILRRNPHRGLRLLWSFLRSQPGYQKAQYKEPEGPTDWAAHTRANHDAMLRPHSDRVAHLRTPREVRSWLRLFRGSAAK